MTLVTILTEQEDDRTLSIYSHRQYSTWSYNGWQYHHQRPSEPRNRIAAVCI